MDRTEEWKEALKMLTEEEAKNKELQRLLTEAYLALDRNVGAQDIYVDYDAVDKLKDRIQSVINT